MEDKNASESATSNRPPNVGAYLIGRLQSLGVSHVFGVPGDYVLGFFKQLSDSQLNLVTTCDELNAGYAADAYARIRGIGAVCVTYSVGGVKVVNATAQAYAEKSPLVVIAGAPGIKERIGNPLLHHKVRTFDKQSKVFAEVTVASAVLDDPSTACGEIDRVLSEALRVSRPVYIELPRDMTFAPIKPPHPSHLSQGACASDKNALQGAVDEAVRMIHAAGHPSARAGIQPRRVGLQPSLGALAHRAHIRITAPALAR